MEDVIQRDRNKTDIKIKRPSISEKNEDFLTKICHQIDQIDQIEENIKLHQPEVREINIPKQLEISCKI